MNDLEHTAPHNIDCEQGLLASCLMDNGAEILDECLAAGFRPEYFYRPAHQTIFEGLCALQRAGRPPEEIVLANYLQDAGQIDAIGGHAYLFELTNRIQTTVHAKHWMGIVRDKFMCRQVIRTCQWGAEQAHNAGRQKGDSVIPQLMGEIEAAFMGIGGDAKETRAVKAADLMDAFNDRLAAQLSNKGSINGVPTGFVDLDRLTFGMQPGEVTIIAARPSMGKSAIGVNIAQHASIPQLRETREPTPTMFFSLEMTNDRLIDRIIYSMAAVDAQQLRNGRCDRQREIADAVSAVRRAPLYFDQTCSLTPYEVRARARRQHRKSPLGLIIVDFLQIMRPNDSRMPREQQVSEMSANMNAMAKELNIPVLVLCQLNRESEKEKRHPRLSDLRESGAIEQNSDVILLLSNELNDVDDPDALFAKRCLIVAKNRNGPVGMLSLEFHKRIARFQNYCSQF